MPALAAIRKHTVLPNAPIHSLSAKSPYRVEVWEILLEEAGLLDRYRKIPCGFREGFIFNYLSIKQTQVPPNQDSVAEHVEIFEQGIKAELEKG
jgi:hypothetical protein